MKINGLAFNKRFNLYNALRERISGAIDKVHSFASSGKSCRDNVVGGGWGVNHQVGLVEKMRDFVSILNKVSWDGVSRLFKWWVN